jgi:biotin carboxylase
MKYKTKVLILGVAPVQLDAILELKKLGYETYACAMAKDGPGAEAADHFEQINFLDRENVIKHIIKNNISLVYSVGSDLAIPVSCAISEHLNLPHFVSENTAETCNNKNKMRTAIGNELKGNLKYQLLSNIDEKIILPYPFILKPDDSQGQRGIFLVNNYDDFLKNFTTSLRYSRSGHVLIEQYINGRELSINGYLVNGELKMMVVSDRVTWPNYIGLVHQHVTPATNLHSETKDEIGELLNSWCKKLQILNGPVYAQIKVENGKPYVIEITPRLDGCHLWKMISLYSGVNLLRLSFEHLLNNTIKELNNQHDDSKERYILEFICQQPNTRANYTPFENKITKSITSRNYYLQGENIRSVNGKFEKIGYFVEQVK